MIRKRNKLVYGWGINDVDYNVYKYEGIKGRRKIEWTCPYYVKWKSIIQRCFDPKEHEKYPTYVGCTICEEWKYLSNFIKWVDSQPNRNWTTCVPDKDFLSSGDKYYSPGTVVFISNRVNVFITDCGRARGKYMIGVCSSGGMKNPYRSWCNNPFTGNREHLGCFSTEMAAHLAWKSRKHEHACKLAESQADERIANKLKTMYSPDKDWTTN